MDEGLLIAFEGLDAAGLTTQAQRARDHVEVYLSRNSSDGPRAHLTKEPTDGPAGGQIRMVLSERLEMHPDALALLFTADRKDHVEEVINPMIDDGMVVITDRYYLSSFAYQSGNLVEESLEEITPDTIREEIDLEEVEDELEWLRTINAKARTPDLTILLDLSADDCFRRMAQSRYSKELFEKPEHLTRVRKNYLAAAEVLREEGEDIRILDGSLEKDEVTSRVMTHIYEKLDELRMR